MPVKIISRAEAIAKGLPRYSTGKPCKHGHVAWRRTKDCICSDCQKIIRAKWRNENRDLHNSWGRRNPEKRAKSQKGYLERHPERRSKSALDWIDRNREQFNAQQSSRKKRKRQTDPDWRLRQNLRNRIRKALLLGVAAKAASTEDLIGCTIEKLKAHLASLFTAGMTWDNYGHGRHKWNIDHVVPCAAFDLRDQEQQRRCFHFSNQQPLWHLENVKKGAKR